MKEMKKKYPQFYADVDLNLREIADHRLNGMSYISYVDVYKNSSYHPHWHDEFEAVYVKNGSILMYINNGEYFLNEGDGAFINSCIVHNYESGIPDTECVMPNVLFGAAAVSGYDELLHEKYLKPIVSAPDFSHIIFRAENAEHKRCVDLIKQVFEQLDSMSYGYEFTVRSLLSELTLAINSMSELSGDLADGITDTKINMVKKMTDFIKCNFDIDIKVSDIADSAAISVRECQRLFSDILDTTPTKYLMKVRIDYSKKLLRETTLSMLQICERCGYSDQSYFTKIFREITGVSPSAYREKHKKCRYNYK